VILSCERNEDDFIYAYKLTRVSHYSGLNGDSIVYFYNSSDNLLKIADYDSEDSYGAGFPVYKEDRIYLHDK